MTKLDMASTYKQNSSLRAWMKQHAIQNSTEETATGEADRRMWPYMYFFQCLGDQEPAIEKILAMITDAEDLKQKAAAQLAEKPRTSADLDEIWDEIRLESETVGQEEIQDIFAGTLFVILSNLLLSMGAQIRAAGGNQMPAEGGRRIGGTSLLQLIRVAGNNFRHHDQWHQPNDQAAQNIAVLEAAGLCGPWNRNRCAEILELVGWTGRKELSLEVRMLAKEIFQYQTGLHG
jgi:hypothetical protein